MTHMAFGDIAATIKALPNVVRGSEVQIISMGILNGKIQYEAALYNSNGEFQNFIGPFPESAYGFRRNPTPAESQALLQLVLNGGNVKRKAKTRAVKKAQSNPKEHNKKESGTFDNSHNHGFRGRINQRNIDARKSDTDGTVE